MFNICFVAAFLLNVVVQCSESGDGKMQAWQIQKYGDLDELQLQNVDIPQIQSPTQVLIEVYATSINQIDFMMVGGYGRSVLNVQRLINGVPEFPMTLGRDFVGVVVQKGADVRSDFKIGDKVWGVVEPYQVGCHAEYVVVDQKYITHKPNITDDAGLAGILYAGLTAWSGLYINGGIGGQKGSDTSEGGGAGKRICILGASGGVGTIAVQMAKAEGLEVTATCSKSAVQMVKDLGADYVIDYSADDFEEQFAGKYYDVIFDCAGLGTEYATKYQWKFEQYITLVPPVLNDTDNCGLICGSLKSGFSLLSSNIQTLWNRGGRVKWGIFTAAPQGIEFFKRHVELGHIKPVVDKVFNFNETYDAYKQVERGHLRGKVIVQIK